MAWNEPGGNKNNDDNNSNGNDKKPNNPWGSGGNQPPDLEKIVTDFIKSIKRALGMSDKPSKGGSAFPFILILLALGAYAVWTSAHQIEQAEKGVVLTFGKYSKTMEPGLNFTWPAPISEVYKVDVKNLYSVEGQGEMLTEDKNLVFLKFTIQYRIKANEVRDYLFKLEDPHATVKHAAESAVRQVVGTNTMDHLLNESREGAIIDIKKVLQSMMNSYSSGIQVTNFNFKEVHPPEQVKDAFDDVVKAREDAKTYINGATKYANKELPLAEGEALKIIQGSEAYKEATIAKAEGESQQFNLVREQYELAPEVTKERLYLETMEQVFSNTSKVLIDSEGSNNMMYLPLDQMLKNSKKPKKDSIYLGTTTVRAPSQDSESSYNYNTNKSSGKRVGRGGR